MTVALSLRVLNRVERDGLEAPPPHAEHERVLRFTLSIETAGLSLFDPQPQAASSTINREALTCTVGWMVPEAAELRKRSSMLIEITFPRATMSVPELA